MGAKIATAVLEIRTDTGQVKGDLGALENVGKKVSQTFQQQAGLMSKGFSDFGSHVRQVQGLVNDFSGQKAIQEAHAVAKAVQEIGGASKLTADQQRSVSAIMSSALQAHKVRGDEASASIKNLAAETSKASTASQSFGGWLTKANGALAAFGVGVGAAGLVGLGKSILDDLGHLEDLHETTSVSLQDLQRLGAVGFDVGLSMDDLGHAVGNLSDRIASGDKKATDSIAMLGLSVKQLQAAGPTEAFIQIAEAAGRIEDPMVKAQVASDIFGDKIGKKLIPLLGDLRQKMADVPKGELFDDKDIQDADRFGESMHHAWVELEAFLVRSARFASQHLPNLNPGQTIQQQIDQLSTLQRLNIFGPQGAGQGKDIGLAPSTVKQTLSMTDLLQNRLTQLRTQAMEPLSAMQKQWIRDLAKWGESEGDIAKLVRASETAVHLYAEELKKADEASKKIIETTNKVHAAQREAFSDNTSVLWFTRGRASAASFIEGIEKVGDGTDETIDKLRAKFEEFGNILLNSKIVVMGVTIPVRMGFSGDASKDLFGSLGGDPFVQFMSKLPNVKPQANLSGFDIGKSFSAGFRNALTDLPTAILRAVQGGGNIASSIAGTVGAGIGDAINQSLQKSIGEASKKGMGKVTSSILSGLSSAIPVAGALLGPLIDKLFSIGGPSKKELEGRKVVADAALDINKVGAAYIANGKTAADAQAAMQRLWASEKKGAEAAKKALEEINAELRHHQEVTDAIQGQGFQSQDEIMHAADIANQAYQEMLASGKYTEDQVNQAYRHYQELVGQLEGAAGEAARAWLKAHEAADGAVDASSDAMTSAEKDLKGLIDQRDELTKSIAAEAPEEIEGVIQQQQEKQRDALDAQIESQATAYAQLARETGQTMANEIRTALERLHINIDIGYNLPGLPALPGVPGGGVAPGTFNPGGTGEAPAPQSVGGFYRVTQPKTFLAGEAGPEDAVFGGAGRNLAQDIARALSPVLDQGAREIVIKFEPTLDGQVLTRSVHRVWDHNPSGLRTEAQEFLGIPTG